MMIHLLLEWAAGYNRYRQDNVVRMIKSILDYGEEGRLFVVSFDEENPEHDREYICEVLGRNDDDATQCGIAAACIRTASSTRTSNGIIANHVIELGR